MIIISPTELRTYQKKYLDLAETERVVIKRGRNLIELKVTTSISPSNDPYFDDADNIAELMQRIKEAENGTAEFTEITEDMQKEILGL